MPRPLPPALDWSLVSSFPPSQTESWGAATRDRKALFLWTRARAPFLPRPRLALASFQPFRMGGHLKTPLMCLETESENAGHFSVCPHVAGSPFVGAVTSPRPFQSVFCPWWLKWPHLHPLQGSRVALAAPCSPEAWRSLLGCDSRRRPGPSRVLLLGSGLEKLSQMRAQAEAPPRRPRVLCWLFIQETSFGCIL